MDARVIRDALDAAIASPPGVFRWEDSCLFWVADVLIAAGFEDIAAAARHVRSEEDAIRLIEAISPSGDFADALKAMAARVGWEELPLDFPLKDGDLGTLPAGRLGVALCLFCRGAWYGRGLRGVVAVPMRNAFPGTVFRKTSKNA